MNANTQGATGAVARPGRGRVRWAVALLSVAALPAVSLIGASSASSASAQTHPTITVEYDATSVNANGVTEPSLIFRGSGFMPLAKNSTRALEGRRFLVHYKAPGSRDGEGIYSRVALDESSTLADKVCTHTVPSQCFFNYGDGELRPFRLFLRTASAIRSLGDLPKCGTVVDAAAFDAAFKGDLRGVASVKVRIPCDTYVLKPPISVGP